MTKLSVALILSAVGHAGMRTEATLAKGYNQMYNLDFRAAHVSFAAHIASHPEDPMGPVSDSAAYLFSEFERLHILQGEFFLHDQNFSAERKLTPDLSVSSAFHQRVNETLAITRKQLAANSHDTNALFANVLALGLSSDYEALIEHRYLNALKETNESRKLAEQLLHLDPDYQDAWIAVGVENYLLSLKPMPVRWVLQLTGSVTDHEYGIQKLQLTAKNGVYLRPFARLLLAVAALRDKQKGTAEMLLQSLAEEFPSNHLFWEELARLRSGAH